VKTLRDNRREFSTRGLFILDRAQGAYPYARDKETRPYPRPLGNLAPLGARQGKSRMPLPATRKPHACARDKEPHAPPRATR